MEEKQEKKRIGVYICHCGGNISDYVDVEQLRDIVSNEKNVVISKNVMFACADSNQKEMIKDIQEEQLDGIVVASCSPKLHLHTFRNVAERAGLNPYNYVQVNVREQCSWAHSDHPDQASYKAAGLIRAGIKRVSHSEALENIQIKAHKSVVIIGAGVSGMRASIDLARMGNQVFLIEKEANAGGQIAGKGKLFPTEQTGKMVVDTLMDQIRRLPNITLFTEARVAKVTGSIGNFKVDIVIQKAQDETISLQAGSILVTTGYETYTPKEGEFGFQTSPRVITLDVFDRMIRECEGKLVYDKKQVSSVAFIYCVGMRQSKGDNKYCSRTCCTSTIHSSLVMHEKFPRIRALHLYRDIRTYGKQEMLYEKSSKAGDIYLMFQEQHPPHVESSGDQMKITVKDHLTGKQELDVKVDLVVLVTGMVPRTDSNQVAELLKIPVGSDKFYNEIHPKLRPVETVINGVFLGGSCQGPKNISESVQSSLSAAAKINAIIRKETIELEPIIARIDAEKCTWCGKCQEVCEYDAIFQVETNGKLVAAVNEAVCKGCGICTPVCPYDAIDLIQYTNQEIEGMIDGFAQDVELKAREREEGAAHEEGGVMMKDFPQLWRSIMDVLDEGPKTIPQIALKLSQPAELITWHMMTMNKYFIVEPAGIDENDEYYRYQLKNKA
ncbi:MAG: CoB--CoM heterodisulfide reductase iron-sulfur subunit A family protein [Bacteroidetes bacterium]|nr:CoB--CoM heterodisulfide reductase iron-sulfur subunit A family protein [Bacteroidota bacterium]